MRHRFLLFFIFSAFSFFPAFSQDYQVKPGIPTIEKITDFYSEKKNKKKKRPNLFKQLRIDLIGGEPYETEHKNNIFKVGESRHALIPDGLKILIKSYPDVKFSAYYMPFKQKFEGEWKIFMTVPNHPTFPTARSKLRYNSKNSKTFVLYYADGAMIPESELKKNEKFPPIFYSYPYKKPIRDPKTYTKKEIEILRSYGADNNKKNENGTPMYFFDALYGSYKRSVVADQVMTVKFLGKSVRVHERIVVPLEQVQKKILSKSKTDPDIKKFIENIRTLDAFFWRVIVDTNRKSFHSLGIALDILPKNLNGRSIYWSWERGRNPDNWMLVPIKARWMPPESVIEIFEEEGFIWGGKWAIFDNMHFEYHPELCIAKFRSEN